MVLSLLNILVLLLGTTFICSRADDNRPGIKLIGVGQSDKLAVLGGYPGIPGPPGLQGPPGPQGLKGDQGPPGKTGDKGLTGAKGDNGASGERGKQGPPGQKGDLGISGKTGDGGLTGEKGDQGSQGKVGSKGPKGGKGNPGPHGQTGDRGLPGPKGDQGAPGGKGDIGLSGEKGNRGEKAAEYQGAKNCKELRERGVVFSGWYTIYPDDMQPLMVLCDMVTDGGGWIVFQRRVDGSIDFYQDWETYKRGFGNQLTEFWLGNENIHHLTSGGNFQLRVDLEDFDNNRTYATYSDFSINGEGDFYRLKLGKFIAGAAGDSLGIHKDDAFSTKDKNNDKTKEGFIPCAEHYKGAWWFISCLDSHLNGQYLRGEHTKIGGVTWFAFRGLKYSLKFTEMKFRSVQK